MSLKTGRSIDRSRGIHSILLTLDDVIDHANEMGRNQPTGLGFRDRNHDLHVLDNESDDESLITPDAELESDDEEIIADGEEEEVAIDATEGEFPIAEQDNDKAFEIEPNNDEESDIEDKDTPDLIPRENTPEHEPKYSIRTTACKLFEDPDQPGVIKEYEG